MTVLGFSLVILAAFCHALWNYNVKRIGGGSETVWLCSFAAVTLYTPLAIYLLWQGGWPSPWQWLFIIGSGLIHSCYFLTLQRGYQLGDLSIVYPTARASGPLLSTIFAVLVLGEHMSLQMAIGGGIIIFGIFNLTGQRLRKSGKTDISILYGLCVGFLIACYTIWDSFSVKTLLIAPLIMDYFSNFVRMIAVFPFALKNKSATLAQWRAHKSRILVVGFFSAFAYILVLTALRFTPVAYVAPLRETSVVFGVLAGSILLKEGHLRHRLIWAAVILFGVGILATG